ncbi:MAG: hypothetical protein NZ891_04905, partial [bacterium]|nr:hypothetical protein [bacterium]MDW8164063.1 hypothetical protein [Candidatus Omnitrophota bacterium]
LFLIPSYYFQIRHLLPLYGILSICLVYPFQKLEYFCISVFLYLFFSVFPYSTFISFLYIFLFLLVVFYLISFFKKTLFYFVVFFLFILFFLFQIDITKSLYGKTKFTFWKTFYKEEGEIWEFIQKNSKDGKNIAYVGSFFIYPFYGENFQNNVFYQSVNSIETIPVYKYKKTIKFPNEVPENLYRENPNFEIWLKGLKKKKTDWLIIKKDKDYIEKAWIEQNPTLFKKIFNSNYGSIYEIIY